MKKWAFIGGILVCGVLFFLSGTLIGYSAYDKELKSAATEKAKPSRKPSKQINPLIGNIVKSKIRARITSKVRIPSSPAIAKAKTYSRMLAS
ncbi:MAG: hypothetical protein LBM19_04295 [Holosporales bacterium]|jgi:hypothetical protein|nr:hypothetical protein [Holosporales bacterium]